MILRYFEEGELNVAVSEVFLRGRRRCGPICFSELFNSRPHLLIRLLLRLYFFYNSKNLNCIGALSFLRLEEEYWRSPFFNQFLEWILKREMKQVKKFGVILVLNKSEKRSEKRVVFVHTAVFERARNWCVKKFFLSERIFFVHVRLLKAVFCNFWWLWGLIMVLY